MARKKKTLPPDDAGAGLVIPTDFNAPAAPSPAAPSPSAPAPSFGNRHSAIAIPPTCPECGCQHCPAQETRSLPRGRIRTDHVCRHCGRRFARIANPG